MSPQWFDREPLMAGAGAGKLEDHPEYALSPEDMPTSATESPETFSPLSTDVDSAVFFLSDENLERLKAAATRLESSMKDERMQERLLIPTNDALIELLWCCMTSA